MPEGNKSKNKPDSSKTEHARQPREFLVVGRIVRPHGIRGALLMESLSDLALSISDGSEVYLGEKHILYLVKKFTLHQKRLLLTIEGINSRNDAEGFRNQEVLLRITDVDPLPEGVYYFWQLLGLEVYTEDGELLGTLEDIIETGANDVYLIRDNDGEELLIPAIESVIKDVDPEEGNMIVHLLPGLRQE